MSEFCLSLQVAACVCVTAEMATCFLLCVCPCVVFPLVMRWRVERNS